MPRRVLVLDDEPILRKAITRELHPEFDVIAAGTVAEALPALEDPEGLCAVVSDLMIGDDPGGLELLGAAQKHAPEVPRLLVSSSSEHPGARDAIASGLAETFTQKPWVPGTVLRAVRAAVAARASRSRAAGPT